MNRTKIAAIRNRLRAAGLAAALTLSGIFLCASATSGAEDRAAWVYAYSMGPGYENLPYSDSYGSYQWALQNSGIFKLVPGGQAVLDDLLLETGGGQTRGGPSRDEEGGSVLSVRGVDLNIIPAWEKYDAKEGKRQVTVALIDTGVDYTHPELADSIWINEDEIPGDGIDNDGNGYIDDYYGWNFYSNSPEVFVGKEDDHGTHSAGTIAAARNGEGITGICDPAYVKIMVLKALGTEAGIGTADNVARAIRYAEANGAVICNLSFGTIRYSEELYRTMKASNMLFVVAAGNGDLAGNGYDIDNSPVYPASFDLANIITVGNLQFDGQLDSASNYSRKKVDLAAPGSYILSTVSGGRYSYMSGTSMAAPMVTGAAAMLYSYDPGLSLPEIKARILNSVRHLDRLEGKILTEGMLDVTAALAQSD